MRRNPSMRRPSLGNILLSTTNGMSDVSPEVDPMHVPQRREFTPAVSTMESPPPPMGQMLSQAVGIGPVTSAPAVPTAPGELAPVEGVSLGGAPKSWKPSKGQLIAGIFADAFAGATGLAPTFAPMIEQRRQQEREQVQWQRNRTAGLQDYEARQRIDQRYATKPADQFTSFMVAAGIDPHSPEGQKLYRQRVDTMAAPPLMAIDGYDPEGNPIKTFMPRNGVAGGQPRASGPPPGTVKNGYRFNGGNPNDRNSWVPVGGAPSNGGATFR